MSKTLIWHNLDWFYKKYFLPRCCFSFPPLCLIPSSVLWEICLLLWASPISSFTPTLAGITSVLCGLTHTDCGRLSPWLYSTPEDPSLVAGVRVEDLKLCNGAHGTSANPQQEPARPELHTWSGWSLKHSWGLICPKFTHASSTEQQHLTFTWVKFQLACFSITWTLWSNTSAT